LGATKSINEKVSIISSFIVRLDRDEWKPFIMMLAGKPVPEYVEGGLGVGFSMVKKALSITVKPLVQKASPSISDIYSMLQRLSSIRGRGSTDKRLQLLSSIFSSLSPEEREWLVRIIFGELRIGVEEGHLLSALAKASNIPLEHIRRAYLLRGSLDEVVDLIFVYDGDIGSVLPVIFKPVRPMLATPASSISEAFSLIGGGEAAIEAKYDGVRVQIHVKGDSIKVFSRRLTDVTYSLPDVVEYVRDHVCRRLDEGILEGEVIGVRGGKPLPFQELMKRFRRVRNIDEMMVEVPTKLYLFDVIYVDGRLLIDLPYSRRYDILTKLVPDDMLGDRIITGDVDEADIFYRRVLDEGHEGVMVKRLDSPYILGSRGKHWIKVKPAEHIDLVIVGAEWGHGRRRGWLSDYYLATYNPDTGGFDIVGKTFKGLTDEEFQYMTKRLLNIMVRDEGYRIWVKPEVVVEVAFNEIQRSPKYSSGMALRLARITRIREDKSPEEATTTDELRRMYRNQMRFRSLR
jgi:DNA ligase-1